MSVLDSFSLAGRTAVVTGSTRGLGRAFAHALADAGADTVIVGRDEDAARHVEAEIASLGAGVEVVLAVVTRRHDVERILERTVAAFGRADVLVNNAGACQRYWIEDAPQNRAGEPNKLGPAIVFLASDASSFMTGSVVTVGGGYGAF